MLDRPQRFPDTPMRAGLVSIAGGLAMALLPAGVQAHDHDAHQRASSPGSNASPVSVPLDAAARATLQRHRVNAGAGGGARHCDGVSLTALLQASRAMPDTPLRGASLERYVLVSTRDGDRVVFSLGELDATLGDRAVYLVDRCDDAPLADDVGPLRLLVPDDGRPARSVHRVDAITVVAAP